MRTRKQTWKRKPAARVLKKPTAYKAPIAKKLLAIEGASGAPEAKIVDSIFGSPMPYFNTPADIVLLNDLQVGANIYQRVGRRVELKYLKIRGVVRRSMGNVAASPTATLPAGMVANEFPIRLLVLYDKAPNGATPVIADILQNIDTTGVTQTHTLSNLNMANRDRFVVLRDMFWSKQPVGANGVLLNTNEVTDNSAGNDKNNQTAVDWYIDLRGLKSIYSNDAGGAAGITTGAIWLVTYCGEDGNVTGGYGFSYSSRLRFGDP